MEDKYFEDQTIGQEKFPADGISKTVYEGCRFIKCDLNDMKITNCRFSDCEFIGCNLSMVKFIETQLSGVSFDGCKLLGCNFSGVSPFAFDVRFNECILDYASFDRVKMPKTPFVDCSMKGVDFNAADLNGSSFIRTNLADAIFSSTNLKNADFTSSFSFIIDPNENNIKNARFSINSLPGLLTKYRIVIE